MAKINDFLHKVRGTGMPSKGVFDSAMNPVHSQGMNKRVDQAAVLKSEWPHPAAYTLGSLKRITTSPVCLSTSIL